MTPVQFSDYSKVDAVNWSTLKEMRRSPRHYRHRLDNEREDTARLALGRGGHTAVFEPDRFMIEYACFKGARRAGKEWEAFKAAHETETILKLEEYKVCLAIRDAVRAHPVAAAYLASGRPEQTVMWTDPKTGIACKARLDWINDEIGAVVDLKTTGDVSLHRFAPTAARMGYHNQLAWYRDGYAIASGKVHKGVIIAVEANAPHDVAVYSLDEDALYCGAEENAKLMAQVKECREANRWPGRYESEMPLVLPAWAFDDAEDDDGLGDLIINGATATANAQEE